MFPQIQPLDYDTAVRLALANLDSGHVETAWSDAVASSQGDAAPVSLSTQEGMIRERRQLRVAGLRRSVFTAASRRLGGATGWLCMDWAWQRARTRWTGWWGAWACVADGAIRRKCASVTRVDFWRVEAVEPGRLLRLRAEMKVPGRRLARVSRRAD